MNSSSKGSLSWPNVQRFFCKICSTHGFICSGNPFSQLKVNWLGPFVKLEGTGILRQAVTTVESYTRSMVLKSQFHKFMTLSFIILMTAPKDNEKVHAIRSIMFRRCHHGKLIYLPVLMFQSETLRLCHVGHCHGVGQGWQITHVLPLIWSGQLSFILRPWSM